MSEELDRIRSLLERFSRSCVQGYAERATQALELLDEYEQRLVKIEGVEEAHDMLRARDCECTVDKDGGTIILSMHADLGRVVVEVSNSRPGFKDAAMLDPELLEEHIAQCIAALHILKGK